MCGICGYINLDGAPADGAILTRMTDSIWRRGPDDSGFHVAGPVGLGVRRLSIIDLADGHQPMSDPAGTLRIVYNGELYNFPELKRELEARGHRFRTHCDTEVVLLAYREWGEDALRRFNGMFAFAIWDSENHSLFLARDHVGIKPLYYGVHGEQFLFGSELKAILSHPNVHPSLDLAALTQYLTFVYVPTPGSIVEGVHKLPPGHSLTWRNGEIHLRQYWDHDLTPACPRPSLNEAADLVRSAMAESVRSEMISDVPVGVLLSGGVDSSAVAAFMARERPGLDSFSIAFDDPSFDESAYAREMAQHLCTNHHELTVSPGMMLDVLPSLQQVLDEPMADASIIPSYILSRFARQHVKVALGGDGGDELFAGYSTLQAHALVEWYNRIPGVIRHGLIAPAVRRLPVAHSNLSFDFKAKRFVAGADLPTADRHHQWLGAFPPGALWNVLSPDLRAELGQASPFSVLAAYDGRVASLPALDQVLYLDMKMYMEGDILVKVDRSSMGNSLETRVPLLNRTLVEATQHLPIDFKLHRFTRKYVLRHALRGIVPDTIIDRKKKGFGIPIARWLNGDLRETANSLLDPTRIGNEGYFDAREVSRLLNEHRSGVADHRMQLWTLMVFQLWQDQYLRSPRFVAA